MKTILYCVYDRAVGVFGKPFTCANDNMALREFRQAFSTGEYSYMASDMDLYKLGEYDANTGSLMPLDKPEYIGGCVNG